MWSPSFLVLSLKLPGLKIFCIPHPLQLRTPFYHLQVPLTETTSPKFHKFSPVLHWDVKFLEWILWFLFITFFIKNMFILMQRTIHHKKWIWRTHGTRGFYYFKTCRFTDMLLKANYFWNGKMGEGKENRVDFHSHCPSKLCVYIYVIDFIYVPILRLIFNVNLVTQRKMVSTAQELLSAESRLGIRMIVNASKVESKYWHSFCYITVQQSFISGAYSRNLNHASVLTPC